MNNENVYGGAGNEAAADTPDTAMSSPSATSPEREQGNNNMNPSDLGEVSFSNLESSSNNTNNNPDEATTTENEQIILETLTDDDDDEEEGEEPLLMMNMKIDDDDVDEKEADLEEGGGSMRKSSPMLKKRLADAANKKTQQRIKAATTMTTVSPPKPLPLYPGTQTTQTTTETGSSSTKKNSPEKLSSSSSKTITIDLEGQQIPNIQRPTSPESSSLAGSLARIYDLSPSVSDRSESPPRRPYRSLSRDNLHAYYTTQHGGSASATAGTGIGGGGGTTAASANAKRVMMNREDENQMTFPGATRGNGMSLFHVESNSGSNNGTLPIFPRPPPTVDREKLEDIFKPLSPLQQAQDPHSPISTASVGKRLSHGARLSRSERISTRHHGLSPLRRSRQTSNLANDFISFTVEDDDAKSVGGNTHPHAASFESVRNLYPQEHIPRLVKR